MTNAWDGFGRMTSTTTNMGGFSRTISHRYDREGRRIELTFPDGVKFWTARDGLGRATEDYQGAQGSTANIMTAFAYNPAGQRSYFARKYGDMTAYAYDAAGRLTSQIDGFAAGTGSTQSTYAYTPAGQLRTESRSNPAYAWTKSKAVNRDYAVNGQNQYTGTTVGGAPGATFTHDANGNLTSSVNPPDSTAYAYDSENRLVSASGTENASLLYDPLGRLFQVHSPATGVTQFLYDGDELVAEYIGWGNLARRYIHGDGSDDPLYWYEGPGLDQPRFPHTNHQGSVTAVAGPGATPLWINAYDEYGIPGAGNQDRFQYTGQAWIPELGMYYYKARFYSPTLGRFLQSDPVGYDDQINLYAYVGNDPISRTDPTGLETYDCRGGAGTKNCQADAKVRNGDVIVTHHGRWSIRSGQGFTIATPISRGSNGSLTTRQMQNIVFNETRSLSGPGTAVAQRNIAHAIMNGDEARGARRPATAPASADVPDSERRAYSDAGRMVLRAQAERSLGYDPTRGAKHFNMRANASTADFQRAPITTQIGPLQNSFPTRTLPGSGIYVNTYGGEDDD